MERGITGLPDAFPGQDQDPSNETIVEFLKFMASTCGQLDPQAKEDAEGWVKSGCLVLAWSAMVVFPLAMDSI